MVGVTLASPPEPILDQILASLKASDAQWIEAWCLRDEIPIRTMQPLLAHPQEAISTATAVGEWIADPAKSVRSQLQSHWTTAIIRARSQNHDLAEILSLNPDLGKQWLESFMANDYATEFYEIRSVIEPLCSALSISDRKKLLEIVRETYLHLFCAQSLVGSNVELYRHLLTRSDLSEVRNAPLAGDVADEQWLPLAEAASDAGMTAEEIYFASEGWSYSWSGPESTMWLGKKERLKELADSSSQIAKDVAEFGMRVLDERIERAIEQEMDEEIFGR